MNWTAILTFTAELAAWVLIAAGLGVIGIAVAAGISRLIAYALFAGFILASAIGWDWDPQHHTPRNHGEGDGVGELGVGQVHGSEML